MSQGNDTMLALIRFSSTDAGISINITNLHGFRTRAPAKKGCLKKSPRLERNMIIKHFSRYKTFVLKSLLTDNWGQRQQILVVNSAVSFLLNSILSLGFRFNIPLSRFSRFCEVSMGILNNKKQTKRQSVLLEARKVSVILEEHMSFNLLRRDGFAFLVKFLQLLRSGSLQKYSKWIIIEPSTGGG